MIYPTKKLFIIIIAGLSLLLCAVSSWAIEYTSVPLPNSCDPYGLQINNGQVIWQGSDGNNRQIFLYDGKQTIQLSSGYYNFEPQIDRGQAAWTYWDGDTWRDDNVQIFLYNGKQTIQLTNSFNNGSPRIDNGQVVWQGRLGKYSENQIFFYDGRQTIQLTHDNYAKRDHQVEDGRVAWSGSSGPQYQVFFYDGIKTAQIFSNSIDDNDYLQMRNGQIAWRSPDNNGRDIFFYDGKQTIQLSNDSYDKTGPRLDNGKVAWSSYDGTSYQIFFYDGKQITRLTNNNYDNSDFQIENGRLVWQGYDGSHYQIFLYDGIKTIQLTSGSYDNYDPQINNGQIVWYGYDGNNGQIFLYDGKQAIQLTNKGSVTKKDFAKLKVDINALFENLLKNDYIDASGIIQNKFYDLKSYSAMSLDLIYESQKEQIYIILRQHGDLYDNYGPQINNGQIAWYGYDRGNAITQIWLAKPQEGYSLELLDGADFSAGRTVTTDTDKLGRQAGTAMQGAVTDGVSRLLLRMETDGTSPVTFSLEGQSNNPETDNGFLQAVENQDSAQKNQSLTVIPVTGDNKNYVFAVYRSPDNFVRKNNADDLPVTERAISIKAETNNQAVATEEIKLVRPPVILVHGLWSGPDMWDGFISILKNNIANLQIFTVNYKNTNASHFEINKNVLFERKGGIKEVKNKLRSQGIAMVQADVVGHSMGGLLARIWAGEKDGIYARNNNFYEGDINKLLTLDSPHYGSFLADVGMECINNLNMRLRELILGQFRERQMPLDEGAVEDLMTASRPIRRMGTLGINSESHTIIGDYPVGDIEFWFLPGPLGWAHRTLTTFGYDTRPYVIQNRSDLVAFDESQIGGLDFSALSTFEHHHMNATGEDVANRTIELLNAPLESNLFKKGFLVRESSL